MMIPDPEKNSKSIEIPKEVPGDFVEFCKELSKYLVVFSVGLAIFVAIYIGGILGLLVAAGLIMGTYAYWKTKRALTTHLQRGTGKE